jgi:flagellar FliL protein
MVDEVVEAEAPAAKKPTLLIIGGIVAVLLLVVIAVAGTLFATGFFKSKPAPTAEQMLEGDAHGAAPADAHGAPATDSHGNPVKGDGKSASYTKQTKKTPEATRFDYSYLQLENNFLVNLANSRKVMSVQVSKSMNLRFAPRFWMSCARPLTLI